MSDQGFCLQIIDRTSFYDSLFSYPNITLLILKTLTFVFKITYYFEISNFQFFVFIPENPYAGIKVPYFSVNP